MNPMGGGMGGGINVGRTSNMGILPSPMDPYRTHGTVAGGRVTPPSNPYGQNQPINFTPGGTWDGGGGQGQGGGFLPRPPQMPPPMGGGIDVGPLPPGGYEGYDPTRGTGGFTGGQMPPMGGGGEIMNPDIGNSGWGYQGPPAQPPQNPNGGMFGGGSFGGGGFRSMYRNRPRNGF
jgi:hypothetical protein